MPRGARGAVPAAGAGRSAAAAYVESAPETPAVGEASGRARPPEQRATGHGRPDAMMWRMLKMACLAGGSVWLLACAFDPARSPAWELAGHPGLLYDVQLFYQR